MIKESLQELASSIVRRAYLDKDFTYFYDEDFEFYCDILEVSPDYLRQKYIEKRAIDRKKNRIDKSAFMKQYFKDHPEKLKKIGEGVHRKAVGWKERMQKSLEKLEQMKKARANEHLKSGRH